MNVYSLLTDRNIVILVYTTIITRRDIVKKEISVAEAKTQLSGCIRQVENGNSLLITRHGKAVAALVPAEDLQHLERLRKAGPEGGLASIAGG
jgi:prevent-host-death family protein